MKTSSPLPSHLLPFIALAITLPSAIASMTKNLEGVSPRIGQRGTTVEVTIVGVSIHDPREIIFFQPGIRAYDLKTPETPPQRRGMAHGGFIAESVVCKFDIAPDCPLGEHPFRLLTATELTCIGTFHVSPFPVIDETESGRHDNDTLETAEPVTPNVTIRGKLGDSAEEELDLYRVPAKAGQQLSVEVDSARLADVHYADSAFDLAVRVLDESGHELAANDDNSVHIQDPMLSLKLPRDGVVYVEVKRSVFTQGTTTYCVHIGTNRRPLIAFPAGGQAGTEQKFTLLGDPLGEFTETLTVPENDGTFAYFGDAPSSVKLRSSRYPNVLEDASAAETRVQQLPAALNGVIDRHDDTDAFRISVKKGEPLHVRLFSASLGSPLDPGLRIRPIGEDGLPGDPELEPDDARLDDRDIFGTSYRSGGGQIDVLDPSVIWEPKLDGDYLIEVSDSSGAGGPTGVYRVEIDSPRTVVQTVLQSRTFDWTESMRVSGLAVPRGNRWTINLSLPKGQWNSLDGEFDLIAHGLPEGVRLEAPRVRAGATIWPVQLVADPSAKPGGGAFTFEAKPAGPDQNVETRCQQNVPFINHSGGDAWRAVRVDRYIAAVTDPAPFSLEIEEPTVALVRGGELTVPVKITRHSGFDGPVEFSVGYVDGSIDSQPPTTIPPGETEGNLRLSATSSAPLGGAPFVVIGSTIHETINPFLGAGHIRVSSKIVSLTVSEPYVELASQPESVRRGEQKKFVWTVQHKTPFEGAARVKLLGLPKGVSVLEPLPALTKDSKEIAFEIEATEEALLGQVSGLSCEVIVPVGDQEIAQRAGSGSLRIDPAL